jgi:glycosyltransferase involved in cell wall biosynthesis
MPGVKTQSSTARAPRDPQELAPLLLDLSHTSHTRARTGIQRVTRSLHAALGDRAVAITHDPHREVWRELEDWERTNLAADSGATKRGAKWPLAARIHGRCQRWLRASKPALPANSGLVVPEVFSPGVAAALPALFASTRGPRVALFHDAIALKFPELTPPKTVARFPPYLVELLAFDGIAAVSEDSRAALLDYWRWLGATNPPPVETIPLGITTPSSHMPGPREAASPSSPPVVLSLGSIEGRKNHLALLDACEQLWARGEKFSLHLIGLAQPQTGGAALARIRELQAATRPLRYDGPVSDAAVDAAYAACTFTVYPSLMEGFGLPVLESVAHGKPCICSARGALGESTRGGGCVALERVDAASLAAAIARLLAAPGEVASLAAEARCRRLRSWTNYAAELTAWLRTLPRR